MLPSDLSPKKIFVRVDYNVPINQGKVTDTTRIEKTLPTLQALLKQGHKIALLAHLGRPKGRVTHESLAICVPILEKLLKRPVYLQKNYLDLTRESFWQKCPQDGIILCENSRFYPQEEKNDSAFAQKLAQLVDIYINDAFSVAHRAHASITGLPQFLPSYKGLFLQKEISDLSRYMHTFPQNACAIIGGSKISTKFSFLSSLLKKMQSICIGGAMAHVFLLAQGYEIGHSFVEKDHIEMALNLLENAKAEKKTLYLPIDVSFYHHYQSSPKLLNAYCSDLTPSCFIGDIGPLTINLYKTALKHTNCILFNGPVGQFENPDFSKGTKNLLHFLQEKTHEGCLTFAGGGDSLAALKECGLSNALSYVSTAGGAFLEWIENPNLPGLKILEQKKISVF